MSTTITVKGLDGETIERLKTQAEQEGMSMAEFLRRLLDRQARTLTPAEIRQRQLAARVNALSGEEVADLLARPAPLTPDVRSLLQRLQPSL